MPVSARKKWVDLPETLSERGFCMTVCALVSMSGGSLSEDKLWGLLETMGVKRNDEAHPKLGDTKLALQRLIKKRYLIREKLHGITNESGGDAYGLALAERAKDEIGVNGVESFVAGIMRGAEGADDAIEV
ncbi:MAGE domain-containing protein [bacterium]|nr:MAGE domain-containing protein [bacterium]